MKYAGLHTVVNNFCRARTLTHQRQQQQVPHNICSSRLSNFFWTAPAPFFFQAATAPIVQNMRLLPSIAPYYAYYTRQFYYWAE